MAETLNHPLAQHVIRLNKIRRAIPALQKVNIQLKEFQEVEWHIREDIQITRQIALFV